MGSVSFGNVVDWKKISFGKNLRLANTKRNSPNENITNRKKITKWNIFQTEYRPNENMRPNEKF